MITITPQYLAEQGLSENFPQRFWAKVNKNGPVPAHRPELGPCWVWDASANIVTDFDPEIGRFRSICASRASYILHFGTIPEGKEVCHHCDHGSKNEFLCVNPSHLFPDTHDGNMKDMVAKGRGRGLVGEAHNMAKLTDDAVRKIRAMYNPSIRNGEQIAKEFGISRTSVNHIVRGHIWSHLTDQPFIVGSLRDIKLTQEKADRIREAYARGIISQRALAKEYGVSPGTIQAILEGRTWVNAIP